MFDYLEGCLLGPLWSDTDYETRRHHGMRGFYALVFWLVFLVLLYLSNRSSLPEFLKRSNVYSTVFAGLLLLSPFLNFIYYKLLSPFRALILGVQGLKLLSFLCWFYALTVPNIKLNLSEFYTSGLLFFDATLGQVIDSYAQSFGEIGLFIGGAFVFLIGLILFILFVCVLIFLPLLLLGFVRMTQTFYDQVVLLLYDFLPIASKQRKRDVSPISTLKSEAPSALDS